MTEHLCALARHVVSDWGTTFRALLLIAVVTAATGPLDPAVLLGPPQ